MTDPEPEPAAHESAEPVAEPEAEPAAEPGGETPEEKRARVMARLAEIIRGDPPQMSGGPVSAGGFPALPGDADEFDQESAAELFGALSQFFDQVKKRDPPR